MTVFAASSLAQTFTDLGKSFESTHPGVKIVFSFQSSSALAAQLNAGAPADVFASASEIDMAKAKDRVPEPTSFVSNRIVLGVLPTSHVPINKMIDLNKRNVTWIQCAHSAPCGAATDKALSVFGKVTSHPVSFEANASSVVAKLTSGEVDAAFIYHTDFVAHSTIIKEIRFGDTPSTQTVYSIGVVRDAKSKDQAEQFVKLVLSSKGLALLVHAGFSRITR
jgi:molybdate transport system substrate-binding protein